MYDFVFDRLRCVRQEIVIQNLDVSTTVDLLQPIVMFLAYSRYRLTEEPLKNYDPKICEQHLQECLKKLLVCYDEIDLEEIEYDIWSRCRIESVYLMFNLGTADALLRGARLPNVIKKQDLVDKCLQISILYWQRNFFKVLLKIQELPDIICAVASFKINYIRRYFC